MVSEGYLNSKQLAEIHIEQAKSKLAFDQAAVTAKFLDEEKLTRAKATYFHLPYVDLRQQALPKDALALLSRENLEHYRFLPFVKQKY